MNTKTANRFELNILHFIVNEKLLERGQKVLVAVSGGVDSMMLLYLLYNLQFEVEALHVNFGLREYDSDMDEELVHIFCRTLKIPFHSKRIKAEDWKRPDLKGQSTQMAARTLRYEWFRQMASELQTNKVALAHHADDQAETVLLHVLRGGGMSSLSGMKAKNGLLIRPFLCITKADIRKYADENAISWRQDESNLTSKYDRNLLRNEIFPVLNDAFPGFQKVLNRNAKRWRGYSSGIQFLVETLEKELVIPIEGSVFSLDIDAIQKHPAGLLFLSEKLLGFGFHFEQVEEIYHSATSNEIRTWQNEAWTKTAHLRGGELVIKSIETRLTTQNILIQEPEGEYAFGNKVLQIQILNAEPINPKMTDKWTFLGDLDKFEFPLVLRKAEPGDRIKPLGMHGKSKPVSEIIAEAKLGLAEMSNVYVLTDQKELVWVLGMRVSEAIKIKEKSSRLLCCTVYESPN